MRFYTIASLVLVTTSITYAMEQRALQDSMLMPAVSSLPMAVASLSLSDSSNESSSIGSAYFIDASGEKTRIDGRSLDSGEERKKTPTQKMPDPLSEQKKPERLFLPAGSIDVFTAAQKITAREQHKKEFDTLEADLHKKNARPPSAPTYDRPSFSEDVQYMYNNFIDYTPRVSLIKEWIGRVERYPGAVNQNRKISFKDAVFSYQSSKGTILHQYVDLHSPAAIKELLSHCNLEVINSQRPSDRATPLRCACTDEWRDSLYYMEDAGGNTPQSAISLLIEAKADVNLADKQGISPIIATTQCNLASACRLLLEAKANPFKKDRQKKNAFDYLRATDQNDERVIATVQAFKEYCKPTQDNQETLWRRAAILAALPQDAKEVHQ